MISHAVEMLVCQTISSVSSQLHWCSSEIVIIKSKISFNFIKFNHCIILDHLKKKASILSEFCMSSLSIIFILIKSVAFFLLQLFRLIHDDSVMCCINHCIGSI